MICEKARFGLKNLIGYPYSGFYEIISLNYLSTML